MNIEPGTLLTAGGMAAAAVYWLVRLEGRLNVSDARYDDLKTDVAEIKADGKKLLIK